MLCCSKAILAPDPLEANLRFAGITPGETTNQAQTTPRFSNNVFQVTTDAAITCPRENNLCQNVLGCMGDEVVQGRLL